MKKILKDLLLFTIFLFYFIYSLKYSKYISTQVTYSINIWINKVIPSLFPTFILVDLIYSTNLPLYINKYLHLNIIYIISIISGSPTNAYMVNKMTDNKTFLLSVSKYISLLFLYNNLTSIYNYKLAIILILLNILSNFIIIILVHPKNQDITLYPSSNIMLNIKNHMLTLITILGTIIFFNTLPLFLIKNKYLYLFISSILEITTFFNNLSLSPIPLNFKLLFTCIAISTCGLCIETQIKSIITDTSINYIEYYKYRLIHLIIYLSMVLISIKLFFN